MSKPCRHSVMIAVTFAIGISVAAQADEQSAFDMACKQAGPSLQSLTRRQVTGDIYEYTAILAVGSGPYDRVGVHRVVRESAPWVAAPSSRAILLNHGDFSSFDTAFLLSASSHAVAADHSLAAALAEAGLDI